MLIAAAVGVYLGGALELRERGRRRAARAGRRAVAAHAPRGRGGRHGARTRRRAAFTTRAARGRRFGGAAGYVQLVRADGDGVRGRPARPRALPVDAPRRGRSRRAGAATDARPTRSVDGTHLRVLTRRRSARGGAVQVARPLDRGRPRAAAVLLVLARDRRRGGIALAAVLGALRRAHRARAGRALHPPHRGARRRPRPVRSGIEVDGRRRARPAGAQLQRHARRARALGRGAAPPRRRRQPRAAHADRQPAREHPDARGRRPAAAGRARGAARRHRRRARRADRARRRRRRARARREARRSARRRAPRPDRRRRSSSGAERRAGGDVELRPSCRADASCAASPSGSSRAVSNLLDNARKWSPPGGVVEVALARRRAHGARPRPRLRRGRPAARLRALLPRRQRARACPARASASRSCARPPRRTAAASRPPTRPAAARSSA